jgi:hypothetical protein
MKVAGIHIALFGGIAASILLAICACLEWTLAQSSGPYGITEAIHGLAFATGGPAHVATFGILIAGISLVAGLQGFAPRWLMFGGLAIAATAELSTLVFIVPAAAMLLPIARFFGFIWMVCAGVVLPKSRGSAREPIAGRTVPRSLGAERR